MLALSVSGILVLPSAIAPSSLAALRKTINFSSQYGLDDDCDHGLEHHWAAFAVDGRLGSALAMDIDWEGKGSV